MMAATTKPNGKRGKNGVQNMRLEDRQRFVSARGQHDGSRHQEGKARGRGTVKIAQHARRVLSNRNGTNRGNGQHLEQTNDEGIQPGDRVKTAPSACQAIPQEQ